MVMNSLPEFYDALFLHYAQSPQIALPSHYNGCSHQCSVCYGLACFLDGLILAHNNEMNNELADLAACADMFHPQ